MTRVDTWAGLVHTSAKHATRAMHSPGSSRVRVPVATSTTRAASSTTQATLQAKASFRCPRCEPRGPNLSNVGTSPWCDGVLCLSQLESWPAAGAEYPGCASANSGLGFRFLELTPVPCSWYAAAGRHARVVSVAVCGATTAVSDPVTPCSLGSPRGRIGASRTRLPGRASMSMALIALVTRVGVARKIHEWATLTATRAFRGALGHALQIKIKLHVMHSRSIANPHRTTRACVDGLGAIPHWHRHGCPFWLSSQSQRVRQCLLTVRCASASSISAVTSVQSSRKSVTGDVA